MKKPIREKLETGAFVLYLFALVSSVVLFGAIYTYARTLVYLFVLAASSLLLLASIEKAPGSSVRYLKIRKSAVPLFLIFFGGLIFFQATLLPQSIVRHLSPEAAVVAAKSFSHDLVAAGETGKIWISLAPYRFPVWLTLVRFSVYALFFLGMVQVLNSRKRIEGAVVLILAVCCLEVLYGLFQTFSGSTHILWIKTWGAGRDVRGTFLHKNSLAGFLESCLILAAGYLAAISARQRPHKGTGISDRKTAREKVSDLFSTGKKTHRRILVLAAGVVIGIGLIFTASRGGMIAGMAGLLILGSLFVLRKRQRRQGMTLLALFLLTAVYALYIGVEYPMGRFSTIDKSYEQRERLARGAMFIHRNYPNFGIGAGAFRFVYPKYQAREESKIFYDHPHNDWVNLLAQTGIAGAGIILAGMGWFFVYVLRGWRKRRDPFAIGLGAIALAAPAAVATHSWVDAPLMIPANMLMLSTVAAIGLAALHLERHTHRDRMRYRYFRLPLRRTGGAFLVLFFALIFWAGSTLIDEYRARAAFRDFSFERIDSQMAPDLEPLRRAMVFRPGNADFPFRLARELMHIRDREAVPGTDGEITAGNTSPVERDGRQMEIIKLLERAVRLNPFRAEAHLYLGWEYTHLWRRPDAQVRWIPAGDLSMARGAYFAGDASPYLYIMLGDYWFMRSRTVSSEDSKYKGFLANALSYYRRNLSLEKGRNRKHMIAHIRDNVMFHYQDEEKVLEFLRKLGVAEVGSKK